MTKRYLYGLPLIILLLFIWEVSSRSGLVDNILLPPPTAVLNQLFNLLKTGEFYQDIGITAYRFMIGYIVGCILAIPAGVVFGLFKTVHYAFEILLEMLRPIPASALIPLALLFFGLGDAMTISIVTYAVFWPVLLNTIEGVRAVDPTLIDTGRVFGMRGWSLILRVIVPASATYIATGMRISLALSITLVIVVEMLVGNHGLGHRIIDAERTFRFAEMYGLVIVIGILGYLVNHAFIKIGDKIMRWHFESHEHSIGA
jgi:ABC-type nitrate/sulfonate/bicarbonate transport system permease component